MTAPIPLPSEPYDGVWNVVYSTARVFWAPVEPRIQTAVEAQTVPVELHCAVEQLTDAYFYLAWSNFRQAIIGQITCQTAAVA